MHELVKYKRAGRFTRMRYKEYVHDLRKICRTRSFIMHSLGRVGTNKKMYLYSVVLNPHAKRATVCIAAGIHGKEESGPLAVVNFLKTATPHAFRHTKVILFPIANPTGFDAHVRTNDAGYDLNRRFVGTMPVENKLMYEALAPELARRKLIFFLSLHEDDAHSVYFHTYGKQHKDIYKSFLREQKEYFPIMRQRTRHNFRFYGGITIDIRDKSFDDRLNRDGVPLCMTAETPTLYPLRHMIAAQKKLMTSVIDYVERHHGRRQISVARVLRLFKTHES